MQSTETNEIINVDSYTSHWTTNPNFGVATAAILVVFLLLLVGWLIKNVFGELKSKIIEILEEVKELRDGIKAITTYINIEIKKKLNGNEESND